MKLIQRIWNEREKAEGADDGVGRKLCKHYLMRIQIVGSTKLNTQFRLEETAR